MELLLESTNWFVKFPIQIRISNSPTYQTSTYLRLIEHLLCLLRIDWIYNGLSDILSVKIGSIPHTSYIQEGRIFSSQNFPNKEIQNCTFRFTFAELLRAHSVLSLFLSFKFSIFCSRFKAAKGQRVELTVFLVNVSIIVAEALDLKK